MDNLDAVSTSYRHELLLFLNDQQDERQLEDIARRAEQTLPSLRNEYEEIMRELEHERAAVAEIENCDQTFLSELKATIAEQRFGMNLISMIDPIDSISKARA